jgi:organic hydroperoxide reductase OsmC/OhrA
MFEDDVSEDVIRLLHDQAHEACFIASSVTCAVEVEPRLL